VWTHRPSAPRKFCVKSRQSFCLSSTPIRRRQGRFLQGARRVFRSACAKAIPSRANVWSDRNARKCLHPCGQAQYGTARCVELSRQILICTPEAIGGAPCSTLCRGQASRYQGGYFHRFIGAWFSNRCKACTNARLDAFLLDVLPPVNRLWCGADFRAKDERSLIRCGNRRRSLSAAACVSLAWHGFVDCVDRGAAPQALPQHTSWDNRIYAISPGSASFLEGLGRGMNCRASGLSASKRWRFSATMALPVSISTPMRQGWRVGLHRREREMQAILCASWSQRVTLPCFCPGECAHSN